MPSGKIIFETPARAQDRVKRGELGERTFVAWLTGDVNDYAIAHDARRFEHTTTEGRAS
jgi:maltooligosyltrehalose trehalohydrolase